MKNKVMLGILLILLVICVVFVCLFIYFNNKDTNISKKDSVSVNINKDMEIAQSNLRIPKDVVANVPIFMYHFVLDDYGENPDVENFIKPSTLEAQLKYIKENNYEPIFINEIEHLENYTKPVALTFDDVFVYFYDNAYPLIKKYNIKVTLNIIADYINGENYLTIEQIKEMLDSGLVSVESHTLTHRELIYLSDEEKKKEILDSKQKLDDLFDINVSTLCYPVGKYNDTVIDIAKEKYKYGLMMTGGVYNSKKHDLFEIPRIYANRSMSLNTFANYLSTSYVKVTW